MIDTVKFYCVVSEDVKNKIQHQLDNNMRFNADTGELYYRFCTGGLKGSYDNNFNVSTEDTGSKYSLNGAILKLEGSYHKWSSGTNAFNGYYNLTHILVKLIPEFEKQFDVKLPRYYRWYVQRVDIAVGFLLDNQDNVKTYINNLSYMTYPRRKTRFYHNESIYCSGTSTTLKIYNKLAEFMKHDMNKLFKQGYDVGSYMLSIQGYIRFECEIKKKKLNDIYNENKKQKNILVCKVKYKDLYEIWKSDFMKLYKINENGLKIVKDSNDVNNRLYSKYRNSTASNLYGFYLAIVNEGYNTIKNRSSKSSFYRKIGQLKDAGIDFSQGAFIVQEKQIEEKFINFNPFSIESRLKEVS